jgi:hypothetical protein
MVCKAFYTDRRGAGCMRVIRSATEAEKLLRGGFGAREARIENSAGELIGQRWRATGETDDRRIKWIWSYDHEALQAAISDNNPEDQQA